MKDSTKSSFVIIAVGLVMIAFSIMLLLLAITQWNIWLSELKPSGMAIIIVVCVVLIIVGVFLIIKFII
jgi:hypothetical protein